MGLQSMFQIFALTAGEMPQMGVGIVRVREISGENKSEGMSYTHFVSKIRGWESCARPVGRGGVSGV